MDKDIFDQIDMLERGARNVRAPHEPRLGGSGCKPIEYSPEPGVQYYSDYNSTYDYPRDASVHQPMELDSFDEQLLQQPELDSRQAQAALGHARLSLPPGKPSFRSTHPAYERDAVSHRAQPMQQQPNLSQYLFESSQGRSPNTSPQRSAQTSSPSFSASLRPPPAITHVPSLCQPRYDRPPPVSRKARPSERETLDTEQFQEHYQQKPSRHASATSSCVQPASINDPPIVQGISLISTRELPDRVRTIYPFPLFNAVQSKCFPAVYKTNDNFVLSSPTGSGKTAVLELAICRLISNFSSGSFKIVYQAPTKSLCAERTRDWQAKFGPLGLAVAELTGDTDSTQMRNVQHATIIVATPEKWDAVTRKWKDHQRLMQLVKLFLIDEVHILNDDRGATLEAVVSRMKSVGPDVRFVALSATVPNSQDIATWLGKDPMNPHIPAPRERFGEEFRPVRLQRHVCGYHSTSNDFAFEKTLNGKLTDVITKWSQRKPLMVFCFTRKACNDTAKLLANWWTTQNARDQRWSVPRDRIIVGDKDLRDVTASGVAFHHAGMTTEDRAAVEKGYLNGDINVICCTSTLAVGVNLPCHMVIIKNTVTWTQGGIKEYSDLEVMQMLGRAGRPQFDNSAVAVIMTRLKRVSFYEKMVTGEERLESRLHLNLVDHLNAEIDLGTITDVNTAKKWLTGTFLHVRLKNNPEHYKIKGDVPGRSLDERLENICVKVITLLEQNDLVRKAGNLSCTEFGEAMARYYIQFETMKIFLALPPKAKISEILSALSQAAEFKEIRFRVGEKSAYRDLNKNTSIKFPIPVNIDLPAHKVSLIIQSTLGLVELPTEDNKHRYEYNTCRAVVFQHSHRLIRCVIDCQLYLKDSITARNALMLARSLGGQAWDDSPLHIKQLESIGPVAVRKLAVAGIKSVEELENTEPHNIERILSRNPPFGVEMQEKARAFPRLRITMKMIGEPVIKRNVCVSIKVKADIGFINEKPPLLFCYKPVYVCLLADTSDGQKMHFARISAKKIDRGQEVLFPAQLSFPGQAVRCFLSCDEIAGTQQTATLKPEIPAFMFPISKPVRETTQQQERLVNAPDPSNSRATVACQSRLDDDDHEFDDAGIDDTDLAAAEGDGHVNINDYDDEGNRKPNGRHKKLPNVGPRDASDLPWEPRHLPNGRWACNHHCKNKTECKHECCRQGLERKPKPPKSKEPKKIEVPTGLHQTQLDMGKTKTTSSHATPTAKSAITSKSTSSNEALHLTRLHNSVKTMTPEVPLLRQKETFNFKTDQPLSFFNRKTDMDEGVPDDSESLNLPEGSDLFYGRRALDKSVTNSELEINNTSDEMLDDIQEVEVWDNDCQLANTGHGADGGQADISYAHDYDSQAAADDWYSDDNASQAARTQFTESRHAAIDKGTPADIDEVFPPAKRHKTTSAVLLEQTHDIEMDQAWQSDLQHLGKSQEDFGTLAVPTPRMNKGTEEPEISVKEWFEREFGTEMFNFVD